MNSTIKINYDLKDMIISAFRYALGRRSYVVSSTAEFIMNYPELIDERVKQVMLNDLDHYFYMRDKCRLDNKCDCDIWLVLKEWLENLKIEN